MLHAVTAISSMHRRFSGLYDAYENERGFALQQYTKAVGGLVKTECGGRESLDVVLTCCLLFATFEV